MTNCSLGDEKIWLELLSKFCLKCITRYLCINWKLSTGNDESIVLYLVKQFNIDSSWISNSNSNDNGTSNESSGSAKHNCLACCDILSSSFLNQCVDAIKDCIEKDEYQYTSFQLLMSMPLLLLLQESGANSVFKKLLGVENVINEPFQVKEILKALLDPLIAEYLGANRKVDSEFEVSLFISNTSGEQLILPQLKAASPESFESKKRHFRKFPRTEEKCTTSQVKNALNNMSDDEIERISSSLQTSCSVSVQLLHQPVYVGGRYNKYSRNLPQTPWIIDGVRKVETSLEEYLAQPMVSIFKADGYNFSSSGREDVDVRMLGNGRPFMLELLNPRKTSLPLPVLQNLEKEINEQTLDVAVSRLQVLKKSDCKLLKEGETEKKKSYSATCYFIHQPTEEQLLKLTTLNELKDIELQQKTPIRVLHRRPLATRRRLIHSLKADALEADSRLFKLVLVTQAGTYIKEFVHSDLGRTSPSLRDYVGAEVDILELDVTLVDVNWPPH